MKHFKRKHEPIYWFTSVTWSIDYHIISTDPLTLTTHTHTGSTRFCDIWPLFVHQAPFDLDRGMETPQYEVGREMSRSIPHAFSHTGQDCVILRDSVFFASFLMLIQHPPKAYLLSSPTVMPYPPEASGFWSQAAQAEPNWKSWSCCHEATNQNYWLAYWRQELVCSGLPLSATYLLGAETAGWPALSLTYLRDCCVQRIVLLGTLERTPAIEYPREIALCGITGCTCPFAAYFVNKAR